jgi:hypothetical protein
LAAGGGVPASRAGIKSTPPSPEEQGMPAFANYIFLLFEPLAAQVDFAGVVAVGMLEFEPETIHMWICSFQNYC